MSAAGRLAAFGKNFAEVTDMSDEMRGIPFKTLLETVVSEYKGHKSLFYVPVHAELVAGAVTVAGKKVSVPLGPAAGPHTQLAQNILSAFAAGARIFELKTVQILVGKELGIVKPCIYVKDEAYNTEWSTELTVREAMEEYIKAYIAIKLFAREFGWDDSFQFHLSAREFGWDDSFQFHLSVGYNLAGIQSGVIDDFLNTMQDAGKSPFWQQCLDTAVSCLPLFKNVDESFIRGLDPHICQLVTLSTMHGCPADEIERIAAYLIEEKGFNTYIKCNPTLLGYERVRAMLDKMGYGYVSFDTSHFDHDMKLPDAVAMVRRLMVLAESKGLVFGVKLTNTFPVQIVRGELQGEAMYMSGKPLFPIEGEVALMFLRPYTGLSDDGLVEMLNGNLHMQLFCGVLIDPSQPLKDGKIVSAIRTVWPPYWT